MPIDPATLRDLVERYESLVARTARDNGTVARGRLEDVSRALCAATGTREVDAALAAARVQLSPTAVPPVPEDDPHRT